MKLDKRGFPKKPIPPKEWAAWAMTNLAIEDWADFYGSQSRLWKRKGIRLLILGCLFAIFALINAVSLIIELTGGAA